MLSKLMVYVMIYLHTELLICFCLCFAIVTPKPTLHSSALAVARQTGASSCSENCAYIVSVVDELQDTW